MSRAVLLNSCYSLVMLQILSGVLGNSVSAQLLAFPEAEGFGRYASGARTNLAAASVYHVTNLNDSGPGSFRDAVSQSNRFVVFDVGGILQPNSPLTFASNITIAGQTAPGGFAVYGNRAAFHGANNLVSRHWAVRLGTSQGRADAASIVRGTNMMFDHMSITWGVDGTFDINPDSGQIIDNLTIQNSIVGQGLDVVGHSTGGLMQPGDGRRFSIIKSLFIDNVTRNPKVRGENEFINNVVYGWESAGYIMGDTSGTSHANVMGNYFIEGPIDGSAPFNSGTPTFHIYANDNWVDPDRDGILDGTLITSYPGADVVATPHAFPTTASMTAQQAVAHVMDNAGVSIIRDAVDTRLMQEVGSYGTLGGVIIRDSDPDQFPGYGTNPSYLNPRARLADADNDGIADNWESAHGLSPANFADWKGLSSSGYTQLEEYLNELGGDGTTVTSTGGTWTTPATWTGGVPTLADDALATGNLSVASGHAFARRLNLGGALNVSGGTVDVFDTAIANSITITGGTVTAGRTLIASTGQSGALTVQAGATLQTGTIASAGGSAALLLDGGLLRTTGAPAVQVPTLLGAAGGTIDTAGYSGVVSGAITGSGAFTKQGAGDLRLTGLNSFAGPTVVAGGSLSASASSALSSSPSLELHEGTTLNVNDIPGGYTTGNGQTISGAGQITGSLITTSGSVLRPQGGEFFVTAHMLGIQAESMLRGSDWAVFNNASHGTGNGGSYNGADLDVGGIVMVANESLAAPIASGLATTIVDLPVGGTWYLFAKVAEPTVSGVTGDTATHPGGNNSFYVSNNSGALQTTPSNFNPVQSPDNSGDDSRWVVVSPTLSPLSGVAGSLLDYGIDYNLSAGTQTFAIGAREIGTVLDAFVLSTTNLTAAQLDSAVAGTTFLGTSTGMTISGNYIQQANSFLEMQLSSSEQNTLLVSSTATLAGNLSVELMNGFIPQASDNFTILSAGNLINTFAGLPDGSRINTVNGIGSFAIDYDYLNDQVVLSDFMAGIAGDFDSDGDVDGRDFLIWQRNPSVGNLADWQSNYGAPGSALAASTSVVPEPSSLVLLICTLLATVRGRATRLKLVFQYLF
ncbi:autotransporter-associated beta strand repeat-containing protein [Bythopirellula goksoeyrii]|nr:autotransporter-associated beta strand repeat-containing protein [Bythopirellula goksoeyrii]